MGSFHQNFGRVFIPLVTPFEDDESIDFKKMQELAKWVVEKNYCDSLIVNGTTGEFYAMAFEERVDTLKAVKDAINEKVPLIAATGCASTTETIKMTKKAEELGYKAVMIVVPYYSKTTQEGIYEHFSRVARSTSLPVMIYNIPLFTGLNIKPQTVGRLVKDCQNIKAIKEEAGLNATQTSDFILETWGADFEVYSGDDTMTIQVLSQGGVGVVTGGGHIVGDMMKRIIDQYLSGEVHEATQLHLKLYKFFKTLYQNGRINPIPVLKAAISIHTGIKVDTPRLPLIAATEEEKAVTAKALKELGKITLPA